MSEILEAVEAAAGGAPGGDVTEAVLPAVARWAAEHADGAPDAVVLVAHVHPRPMGAIEVDAPTALVAAAAPELALAVVAGGGGRARWSSALDAVRAVVEHVGLPAGAGATVAQALDRAPERGGLAPGPMLGALEAAVAAERLALAGQLHDGPVQELTAAQLLVDSALLAGEVPAAVREPMEQGLAALRAAVVSCRRLMAELSGGGA